jgi:hypothetical protein
VNAAADARCDGRGGHDDWAAAYFFLPPEERRLPPELRERVLLERDDPRPLDELDFDRDVLARDPLERDFGELALEPLERDRVELDFLSVERERVELDFFPLDREDDFFVVDRLVVEALLVEPLLEDFFLVGGDGVAGGALAAAVRARPPGVATSTSKPSSASAMSAPTVIASAAARPRKMPTFRVGEPATIRQRISRTASAPSVAVNAPRRSGMLSRCPAAARHASAIPETPDRMIRKPGRSVSAFQPLIPARVSERLPALPVSSAPPLNQSKNRNTNMARPPMPATISPVRSRDEPNSASVDGVGPRVQRGPRTQHAPDSTTKRPPGRRILSEGRSLSG